MTSTPKTAFVGSQKGELTLMLSPVEVTLGVDFSLPGHAPFVIKHPLSEAPEGGMAVLFNDMVLSLICLVKAYFEAQGVELPVVEDLGRRIYDAVEGLNSGHTSKEEEMEVQIDQESMFEAAFDVPPEFLGEAHAKVVTASAAMITRPPKFQPRQIRMAPQTRPVKPPEPSLRNVIQKFKSTQNKPLSGPLYVLVYDSCGRPVGVRSIKGPGWRGIGGKMASLDVVEIPGYKPTTAEVFTDPSRGDLARAMGDSGEARAFVFPQQGKVVAWNAFVAIHSQMAEAYLPLLGLNRSDAIPVTVWPGGYVQVTDYSRRTKWFHDPGTAEALARCAALRRALGCPVKEVFYFDEAIVGDWKDLQGVTTSIVPLHPAASKVQASRRVAVLQDAGAVSGVMVYADYPGGEQRVLSITSGLPGVDVESRLLTCLDPSRPIRAAQGVLTVKRGSSAY